MTRRKVFSLVASLPIIGWFLRGVAESQGTTTAATPSAILTWGESQQNKCARGLHMPHPNYLSDPRSLELSYMKDEFVGTPEPPFDIWRNPQDRNTLDRYDDSKRCNIKLCRHCHALYAEIPE